jgi:hypothetical protein
VNYREQARSIAEVQQQVGEEESQLGMERGVGGGLGECIFRPSHVLEQAQSDSDFLVGLKD